MINVDNRNWPEYNEKLVKRGWFYLSTDFVKNWDKELKKMNKRKNGRPYRYPETFIQFSGEKYEVNCRKGDTLRHNWTVCIEIMDKVLYGNHQLVVNRNPL